MFKDNKAKPEQLSKAVLVSNDENSLISFPLNRVDYTESFTNSHFISSMTNDNKMHYQSILFSHLNIHMNMLHNWIVYCSCPQFSITTSWLVFPLSDPTFSTALTTDMDSSSTFPNTTCLPSNL